MGQDQPKRRKGRPLAAEGSAGREGVVAAAAALLQKLPPNQVTITAVAREANVDPALVRYYFGDREALLLAVVRHIAEGGDEPPRTDDPVGALEAYIHRTFRFTRAAKNMQRLMIEELDSAKSPEVRAQVQDWNRGPVAFYDDVQDQDGGRELAPFDAVFLHMAIVGISDFFVAGAPLLRMLVPDGTDMAELDRRYEAFVVRLLLDGLRKR